MLVFYIHPTPQPIKITEDEASKKWSKIILSIPSLLKVEAPELPVCCFRTACCRISFKVVSGS